MATKKAYQSRKRNYKKSKTSRRQTKQRRTFRRKQRGGGCKKDRNGHYHFQIFNVENADEEYINVAGLDYKIKDIHELSKHSLKPVGKRGDRFDEFIMIPVNNKIILPGNVIDTTKNNNGLYCSVAS